ncbi:phenylalanine--tRNA ligase alpha subunit [Candidatus Dependentiae bacterium Noda2021]|nr:phenylalanine--tRNA ligase alpha subunit [Candidatus Dependentiae bacterium Noda2021]
MLQQIQTIKERFISELESSSTLQVLEHIRVSYLGRNGKMTELMTFLKNVSPEEKRTFGPKVNELRDFIQQSLSTKTEFLKEQEIRKTVLKQQNFDVTAYKPEMPKGTLHIYTQLIEQLENIFISMGYEVASGPEVETNYYNFSALNIPDNHPARELHDTFWLTIPNMLLRTHTSTVQIRTMEQQKPPIAVVAPGRCYRNEATDATHDFMFTQVECMLIDKNITISHLLATAKTFLQEVFGKKDLAIRVRPGYFPFVEPGFEIDASCPFCTQGCSACKKTRWIELLGAGLIHPNVLKCGGIDPQQYSGFAFGMGLERLAMIKYGIQDIRLFHSSKIEFLNQF